MPIAWYHGGPKISEFKNMKWDRPRNSDQNANGPGVYWTNDQSEAARYGKYLYRGAAKTGFKTMPNKAATSAFAKKLFALASEEQQDQFLENFDSLSVDDVMTNYTRGNTMLDASVLLYHDLFGYNSDDYVKSISKLYDGVIVSFPKTQFSGPRKHLIVWSPEKMTIKELV